MVRLEQDVRPDGRELSETRPITINIGSISTAEGSALVKLGNTTVICGIKGELTTPKPEEPKKGFIVPNVDLPPLCSPLFKPGPPSELAQSATTFMDSLIIESGCISLEDLCIEEGKLCWVLYCDMVCLDFDGNLLDACCVALLAALKNTLLPTVKSNEDTGLPETDLSCKKCLALSSCPVSTTFAVFDDKIMFVDPTQEEEAIATGMVTIVATENHINNIYKPGGTPLSEQQLQDCIKRAHNNRADVTGLIQHTSMAVER